MKTLHSFLFLFFSLSLFSQTYCPLVGNNRTWKMANAVQEDPFSDLYIMEEGFYIQGDSMINGNTYFKLYQTGSSQSEVFGLLREDSLRRVYFIGIYQTLYSVECNGAPPEEEILLYNFNGEVGDTLKVCGLPIKMVEKDTIIIEGQFRPGIWVEHPLHLDLDFWVEGIGSMKGFFSPLNYEWENQFYLTCFQSDNITYNIDTTFISYDPNNDWQPVYIYSLDCDLGIYSPSPIAVQNLYPLQLLYPNPFRNQLNIELFRPVEEIRLRNYQGHLLFQHSIKGQTSISLTFPHLSSGVYLLELWEKDRLLGVKTVIIEK